jgi:hypothetical protein
MCYFGIAVNAINSGPFCNLIFDIGTAAADITHIDYEYWNGGWTDLPNVNDNTSTDPIPLGSVMDILGVNGIFFAQPWDWVPTSVGGINAYWVRINVIAVGAAPTPPAQQNRDIYTVVTPFVSIDDAQVTGDITAFHKVHLNGESADVIGGVGHDYVTLATAAHVGLRSTWRDINPVAPFTPFLNASDEQSPNGVYADIGAGAAWFDDIEYSPSGRCVQYTPAGIEPLLNRVSWLFNVNNLQNTYQGSYRVFLRIRPNAGGCANKDYSFRFTQYISGYDLLYISPTIYPDFDAINPNSFVYLVDLGSLNYNPPLLPTDIVYSMTIYLQVGCTRAGPPPPINIYDMILMPVDENYAWGGDWSMGIYDTRYLLLDSISMKKRPVNPRCLLKYKVGGTSNVYSIGASRANDNLLLQANIDQRLWFLMEGVPRGTTGHEIMTSRFDAVLSVQSYKHARYLGMRGAR